MRRGLPLLMPGLATHKNMAQHAVGVRIGHRRIILRQERFGSRSCHGTYPLSPQIVFRIVEHAKELLLPNDDKIVPVFNPRIVSLNPQK